MAIYANERNRARSEGGVPRGDAETDTSIAANMLRAQGRTVSPQPASELDLTAKAEAKAEAQSR